MQDLEAALESLNNVFMICIAHSCFINSVDSVKVLTLLYCTELSLHSHHLLQMGIRKPPSKYGSGYEPISFTYSIEGTSISI